MNQISMCFWQDAAVSSWTSVAEQLPQAAEFKPLLSTEDQAIVELIGNDLDGGFIVIFLFGDPEYVQSGMSVPIDWLSFSGAIGRLAVPLSPPRGGCNRGRLSSLKEEIR